jgi:serine/threonine protein kinase
MGCSCSCSYSYSNSYSDSFINDYEKLEEIGKGGFSKIYRVKKDEREYAIKEFNKEKEEQYQNEISILKKFEHNNIIKYIDSFQIEEKKGNIIDKKFYIILEYCKSDLRKLIKNYNNALINPQLIYIIIKDICLGLKEIHSKNIIHLDIKPENILIGVDNKIKIADFNISKKMNNNLTSQVGTYDYMAPEVLKKKIMIKKQIYFLWEL